MSRTAETKAARAASLAKIRAARVQGRLFLLTWFQSHGYRRVSTGRVWRVEREDGLTRWEIHKTRLVRFRFDRRARAWGEAPWKRGADLEIASVLLLIDREPVAPEDLPKTLARWVRVGSMLVPAPRRRRQGWTVPADYFREDGK